MTSRPPDRVTQEDRLLDGRVRLIQSVAGYRVAIDPVLLAAACPARPGDRVVELGCGTGAALACLAARIDGLTLAGVEIDAPTADLARRTLAANGLTGDIRVADVHDGAGHNAAVVADLGRDSADQVIANPPYWPDGQGTPPANADRRRSHAGGDLAAWIAAARAVLKPKGWLTLILPAARWGEAAAAMSGFGALTMVPIWPKPDQPAKRVILRARKGVASPSTIVGGLTLHRADGGFTSAATAILRQGAPLAPHDRPR